MVDRVVATDAAAAVIERLKRLHGPLMFHQSGGCCDGSSPMCYPDGEFRVGGVDVRLGAICGSPFWMWSDQYAYFANSQLIIDVVPGRGAGFSLESPEGFDSLPAPGCSMTRKRTNSPCRRRFPAAALEPLA